MTAIHHKTFPDEQQSTVSTKKGYNRTQHNKHISHNFHSLWDRDLFRRRRWRWRWRRRTSLRLLPAFSKNPKQKKNTISIRNKFPQRKILKKKTLLLRCGKAERNCGNYGSLPRPRPHVDRGWPWLQGRAGSGREEQLALLRRQIGQSRCRSRHCLTSPDSFASFARWSEGKGKRIMWVGSGRVESCSGLSGIKWAWALSSICGPIRCWHDERWPRILISWTLIFSFSFSFVSLFILFFYENIFLEISYPILGLVST